MSSENLHESPELLTEPTKNLHRGITSLVEELEAVDWYTQRAEACSDAELRTVLLHNRDEEIEHAMMNLEWLRRNSAPFDEKMRTYLFKSAPIVAIEADEEAGAGAPGDTTHNAAAPAADGSLGIGSLKRDVTRG